MSFRINANMQQNVANQITRTNAKNRHNAKQMASGVRIYAAAQDPGGVAMSEKFRARIQGLRESARNIGQAQNMLNVASGVTETTGGALERMRELAVQGASGTLSTAERASIQQEFSQLQDTLSDTAETTEFNGLDLADGSTASVSVQVGPDAGDSYEVALADLSAGTLGVDAGSVDVTTQAGAESAIGAIDNALDQVHSHASAYGAAYNRLGSSYASMQDELENMVESESRIRDVDFAEATAEAARNEVMKNAGIAVMVQSNSDSMTAARLLF